jgi:hypothetical protein
MPKPVADPGKSKPSPATSFHDLLEKSSRLIEALQEGARTRREVCEVTGLSSPVAMNLLLALDAEMGVKIEFNKAIGAYELVRTGPFLKPKKKVTAKKRTRAATKDL